MYLNDPTIRKALEGAGKGEYIRRLQEALA